MDFAVVSVYSDYKTMALRPETHNTDNALKVNARLLRWLKKSLSTLGGDRVTFVISCR